MPFNSMLVQNAYDTHCNLVLQAALQEIVFNISVCRCHSSTKYCLII